MSDRLDIPALRELCERRVKYIELYGAADGAVREVEEELAALVPFLLDELERR